MENLEQVMKQAVVDGQLPCAVAFVIAAQAGLTPQQVGEEADRLEISLSKCQLGLFGYGPKAEGKHRQVTAMKDVPADLAGAIRAALGADGKLPCSAAWQIAAKLGLPKQTVSDAVEGLGLRVSQCQLGAF